jgi:hypothetical protein
MSTKITLGIIAILLIFVTIGSGILAFQEIGVDLNIFPGQTKNAIVDGSTKIYDLNDFSQVDFRTFGKLNLVKGDKNELKVEAQKDVVDRLKAVQVGNKVTIDNPKLTLKFWTLFDQKYGAIYTLTYKGQIENIDLAGDGDIVADDLSSASLKLFLKGSGDITLHNAKLDSFSSEIAGSGNIKADGECNKNSISIIGSGDVSSARLKCADGSVSIKGSGNARVNTGNLLNVSIVGSGDVYYIGPAVLTKDIRGSGEVTQVQE